MTIQTGTLLTPVEHVLVVGTTKLWEEWVNAQMQEYDFSTHHKDVRRFIVDDTKTAYHFVSSSSGDQYIIDQTGGKLFHRWYNLGVQVSPEVREYLKTRCRLT